MEEVSVKDNTKIKEKVIDCYHYDRFIDYVHKARKYNDELNAASDDELLSLYNEMQSQTEVSNQDRSRQRDFYAFFNLDASRADVPFWSSLRSWTAEEAVALSLGKDPRKVNPGSLKPYRKVARSLFSELFEDRLILIKGAIAQGDLKLPLNPHLVIAWANEEKSRYSCSFLEFKADFSIEERKSAGPEPAEMPDFALNTRSAQTLYSCLILLLIKHYDYKLLGDLKAEQGKTFTQLESDLQILGVPVTAKPLREHMAAARRWAGARLTAKGVQRSKGIPSE